MNDIQPQRTPDVIGAEIRGLTQQAKTMTLWFGIEIGRRLTEAKEMLEHGQWLAYLKEQTEFSQPSALCGFTTSTEPSRRAFSGPN